MSNILKRVLNVIFSDWTVFLPQYSTEKGILSYFTDIQKFLVNFICFFFFFFFSVEAQVQALHCPSSVTEGSSVNLQCNATGNPSPNITWIWQDTGIVLGSNGHFVLVDVHRSHTGIYQCHAWNGIGNSSINTCYLDVFCKSITCKVCSACFS